VTAAGLLARTTVIFLLFCFSVGAEENANYTPELGAFIARIIRAYGGPETIARVKTVYAKGNIRAQMLRDEGVYVRYFKRNRKLRVETSYNRSSERRILNDKKGWRSSGGIFEEVKEQRYLAMVYQYKQLDLPYGLLMNFYRIKDAGRGSLNGIPVRVLQLRDDEGPPMNIYVDLEKFYIVASLGYFTINNAETDLTAEFSDFRLVEGMPFPFRIINYGGGNKIGETSIQEYSINKDMDDSLFAP